MLQTSGPQTWTLDQKRAVASCRRAALPACLYLPFLTVARALSRYLHHCATHDATHHCVTHCPFRLPRKSCRLQRREARAQQGSCPRHPMSGRMRFPPDRAPRHWAHHDGCHGCHSQGSHSLLFRCLASTVYAPFLLSPCLSSLPTYVMYTCVCSEQGHALHRHTPADIAEESEVGVLARHARAIARGRNVLKVRLIGGTEAAGCGLPCCACGAPAVCTSRAPQARAMRSASHVAPSTPEAFTTRSP